MRKPIITREAWVAALRSGKYAQGTGQMVQEDTPQFCCLGVACEIAGVPREEYKSRGSYIYYRTSETLNHPSQYDTMRFRVVEDLALTDDQQLTLANMNDRGETFSQIADAIEAGNF